MTSPATTGDDNASRWRTLLANPDRSEVDQARIEAAIELAATTLATTNPRRPVTDPARDLAVTGAGFSQLALAWHQVLADTHAFARARASDATTCRYDPTAVREWLLRDHPDRPGSVAAELGIGDDFDLSGFHKWTRITNLVDAAQQAGVFGVPDHKVGVLHLAGDHGYVDRHRITLTTPQHGVLCSADLDTADLLTEHLAGVDAATHLLATVAHTTDRLLHQRALLADVAWPTPTNDNNQNRKPDPTNDRDPPRQAQSVTTPRASRAFRPLAVGQAGPAVEAATAPTPSGHRAVAASPDPAQRVRYGASE